MSGKRRLPPDKPFIDEIVPDSQESDDPDLSNVIPISPVAPQRKKSSGTIREKEFKKGKTYSNVVCRLTSICSDRLLVEEIKRTACAMKQVQMEAWHLVNLHTLRCLENNLPLPDFGKTFFDHCCSGVASTSQTHSIAEKNPLLWDSITIYREQRAQVGLTEVPGLTGYPELKLELREQMVVNAGVMIREHFRKRLRAYVEITFGQKDREMTKTQKQERKKRLGHIMQACYNVEDTDQPEALQMRDILTPEGVKWSDQWIPWPNHINENGMAFYVRLTWQFQNAVEARMTEVPNEKGVRAFSLFPVSTSYVSAHITINGSTLAGFYSRIRALKLKSALDEWGKPGIPLNSSSFKQNRWTVLRHTFDIAKFETRNPECRLTKAEFAQLTVEKKYENASRLFANQVTTDGYSASVLLIRPKTDAETSHERAKGATVVPVGYMPNVVIGLDPGMRAVCTAVREDFHRVRPQKRRCRQRCKKKDMRKKSNRPRWIKKETMPRHRNGRDIVSVTTQEYRHMAGFNRFRAWNEGQKRLHPDYSNVIAGMPSFKTSSYELYLERLKYFWRYVKFLLQFCADRPFLKWKFFQKRMARVAVDEIARRIVPTVSRLTCVAFGDWSRRKGIRGHAPSPVKGLKEALRERATVISMDEFRTSKLCSQCHQSLSEVRYTVDVKLLKRRKRRGVVLARDRAEIEFKSKRCHAVLRCEHENCEARYWDRDVNAAINMLELLKSELLGRGRMEAFERTLV